jgi:hypothetical protein
LKVVSESTSGQNNEVVHARERRSGFFHFSTLKDRDHSLMHGVSAVLLSRAVRRGQ